MAVITLELAEKKLRMWLDAEDKIAIGGQKYKIGKRELTRADLKLITERITYWNKVILKIKRKSSGPRSISIVLRDL